MLGTSQRAARSRTLLGIVVAAVLTALALPSQPALSAPGGADEGKGAAILLARGSDGVDIDVAALESAMEGDTFLIELPGGPTAATVELRDEQPGFTGWSGPVGGGWFDAIQGRDGVVHLELDLPETSYVLDQGRGTGYRFREQAEDAPPHDPNDAVIPPAQLPRVPADVADRAVAERPKGGKKKGPRKIRVLFVYSPQAMKAAGGKKKIRRKAQLVIQQTNATMKNSKTGTRVVITGVKRTSKEVRSVGKNLKSLWKRDGRYDAVPRWRARKNADLVHLFVKTTQGKRICGRGYLRPRAKYAYSVAAQSCATRFRSSTHEIGHNLGADHDARAGYRPTSRLPARAKVNIAKRWYTVMAYHTACSRKGVYCDVIPFYSNPFVKYQGDRVGTKGKSNNAGVIRKRARAVSKFR